MNNRLASHFQRVKVMDIKHFYITAALLFSTLLVTGCFDEDKNKAPKIGDVNLRMNLPDSLTGGQGLSTNTTLILPMKSNANFSNNLEQEFSSCEYKGPEDDDIFKNGYNLTQFMVSGVASWMCIGDIFISISSVLPAKDKIHKTKHNADKANYDPEEPTHIKVTRNNGYTSVYLYYGFGHSQALPENAIPGFFITWIKDGDNTSGKMIIDANAINNPARDADDPTQVRMDFNYTTQEKIADMYMRFDEGNPWANGFRIQVMENLTAPTDGQVFIARGKVDTTGQYADVKGISEIPVYDVYTVSDANGKGASHAEFSDLGLALPIDASLHLGDYIADKLDIYFFDQNSNWDWVEKTFQNTELRGDNRNLSEVQLGYVESFLELPDSYFTNNCKDEFDDCDVLINRVFEDGFYEQEPNQGSDPQDWRSTALGSILFLDSVYPAGSNNWNGVFVMN